MPSPEEGSRRVVSLTSPLRAVGYAAILTAIAFMQAGDRMVADTKFDLLTDPTGFMSRAFHLWDPRPAFGQIPDQAYGYAWPMGPFFALGKLAHLPPWAIQRLWWAVLLCLAFFGMLRLCRALGMGSPTTQVVASFAYVLTPRITTLVGAVSVEIWPMALAPWVLLPLVRGSTTGRVRTAAARSALVVACCGGVNAIAVAAVLPLGVVWLVTRAPGPRRWRLLGWWTGFTVLATLWWSGPLVLMGRYSPPFLDYIENAAITTVPTGLARTLLGVSDWVAYFGGTDFAAGRQIVTTPFLLLDAAAIVALGLVGICLRGHSHHRFLTLGLLTGLVLVGLGYANDLAGFFAADRMRSLDYALAPLRNLHKFDVVLRIPLVLGLAHALVAVPRLFAGKASAAAARVFRVAVGLALCGLLFPWFNGSVPAYSGPTAVPDYWYDVADYLAETDDGTVALELPASSFGIYDWGNVHDDVMQGLGRSPWAVRNVVPLAQPGSVVFLDAVTRVVESGHPSPTLAGYLAVNGVGRLVVRNDLNRIETGAPDPAYMRSVLTQTPGLTLVRSFGPEGGAPAYDYAPDAKQTRIVTGRGISATLPAVDVYTVRGADEATLTAASQLLVGDPSSGSLAQLSDPPSSRVLAADAGDPLRATGALGDQVLTDDMKRREMNFPAVRWNESSTLPADRPMRLAGKEQSHRVVDDEERWQTTEAWNGEVVAVNASSSQAFADAVPPLLIGAHPGAALDGDPSTAWQSAHDLDPNGQWWQVDYLNPRPVGQVTVTMGRTTTPVKQLTIEAAGQERVVEAPAPGERRSYPVDLPVADSLRITASGAELVLTGAVSIAEVAIDDLTAQRYLSLPDPLPDAPVDVVSLTRDPDRATCVQVGDAFPCDETLAAPGEDADTLARSFTLATEDAYQLAAVASLRRGDRAWDRLLAGTGLEIAASEGTDGDVASGRGAMVDGDASTTWIATGSAPRITLTLPHPRALDQIQLKLNPGAAASQPARILVRAPGHSQVVDLDSTGRGDLPGWRTRTLTVTIQTTYPAFSYEGSEYTEAPPGISELWLNGAAVIPMGSHRVTLGCGQGPIVAIDGHKYRTSLTADVHALVHGEQLPLHVCDVGRVPVSGSTMVLARPRHGFRVDSVTLTRPYPTAPEVDSLAVERSAGDLPTSVALPEREAATVLALPQNINSGWLAYLDGDPLEAQRVDGWRQGWVVPAGPAAVVTFEFTPNDPFHLLLVVGAGGVLLCLLAAVPLLPFRRRVAGSLPPLSAAPVGRLDVVLLLVAGGLLTGVYGVVVTGVAIVAGRRVRAFQAWAGIAAGATMAAAAALTWPPLKDQDWAATWTQAWTMLAVAMVVAAAFALASDDPPEV